MTSSGTERTRLLEGYVALRVHENPGALLAARVSLGTASFAEKVRYYLGLGPPGWMVRSADSAREFREWREGLEAELR